MEDAPEPRASRDHAKIERAASRRQAARAHVVAERRDVDALRHLGLGDERAGAATAHQVALADELVQRRAHGEARHAEVDSELPLGGDRIARAEALDQLEDPLPRLTLLGQETPA